VKLKGTPVDFLIDLFTFGPFTSGTFEILGDRGRR